MRLNEICEDEMDIPKKDQVSKPEDYLKMATESKYFSVQRSCLIRYYLKKKFLEDREDSLAFSTLLYEIVSKSFLPIDGMKQPSTHLFVADVLHETKMQKNYQNVLELLQDHSIHGYGRVMVDTIALKALLKWITYQRTKYIRKYVDDSKEYALFVDDIYTWTSIDNQKMGLCLILSCLLLDVIIGFLFIITIKMPRRRAKGSVDRDLARRKTITLDPALL